MIEAYEANWKFEIFKARARANASADADGFVKTQKQYVPKSAIISSEDSSKKTGGKKGRSRVNSSAKDEKVSYVYMPKNVQPSQEEAGNTLKPPSTKTKAKNSSSDNKFKNLLGGLKPDTDSHSEDEQATEYEGRKASMHQVNVVGMNFEKYNDLKPNNDLKLKI